MKKLQNNKYSIRRAEKLGWGTKSKINIARANLIIENVQGKNIIDIGCGLGVWTDFLTKKGFNVVGVDFEKSFINKAKTHKKGSYLLSCAEKLPFKKGDFDTALLINILEHTNNDLLVLNEAARVAKKVIINVPQQTPQDLADKGLIFKHHLDNTHKRTYTPKSLKSLIEKSGLSLVSIIKTEKLPNKWVIYELLNGSSITRKILLGLLFLFVKPKKYHLELFAIAKIK